MSRCTLRFHSMASQSCLISSSTQAGPCPNATAPRPLIRVSSPYNAFDGRYTDEDRSNRRKKPHHHSHTLMFSFLNHSPLTTLDSDSYADAPHAFLIFGRLLLTFRQCWLRQRPFFSFLSACLSTNTNRGAQCQRRRCHAGWNKFVGRC